MTVNVTSLNNDQYVVIDLDSGTVLGTNIVLVPWPEDETIQEEILSNDNEAFSYAQEHGIPLQVELP